MTRRKRIVTIVGGLAVAYVAMWGLTWSYGVKQVTAEYVETNPAAINWRSAVQLDYDPVQRGQEERPEEWWFVGDGWSPAPFVVVVHIAQEGVVSGVGGRCYALWVFGRIYRVSSTLVWRTRDRKLVEDGDGQANTQ